MMSCENGTHESVIQDQFAQVPGARRYVPGDCYCLDCKQPLPAYWNDGHPVAIEEEGAA